MRAGLLGLLTFFFLVVPSASKLDASTDTYRGVDFHPFTMAGCTAPDDESHGVGNCDPVNLIFPGKTWWQVRDALTAAGWTTLGFGSSQLMHFTESTVLVSQHVQLFYYDGLDTRYHVRIWQGPKQTTIASVHHERGAPGAPARLELGRRRVIPGQRALFYCKVVQGRHLAA